MKKEELKKELQSLIDAAAGEQRGFTKEELARTEEIKLELNNLRQLDNAKSLMESIEVEEKKPAKESVTRSSAVEVVSYDNGTKDQDSFEARAWCKAKMGSQLTETEESYVRSLDVANDGNVIPTLIMDRINEKIHLESGLIGLASKMSVPSTFTIFDETTANAGAVRATDVTDASGSVTDSELDAITLAPKYLYNEVVISNALARQAGADIEGFVVNTLGRRLGKLLDDQIVSGAGSSGALTGLDSNSLTIATQATLKVEQGSSASGTITEAQIASMYYAMPTEVRRRGLQTGSLRWLMNETTFKYIVDNFIEQAGDQWADSSAGTEVSELKVSGNIKKLHRDITRAPMDTLFGIPVVISDAIGDLDGDNTVSVCLMDASRLLVNTFKAPSLDRVSDSTLLRKGQSLFGIHADYDAAMTDHRALVQFHNEDTA